MSSYLDIEKVLNDIRQNAILLSSHHKKRHYELKEKIKYFRLPTIILSAFNSVFSIGLQPYIEQKTISITNCLISLVCGVIVSIEMYLNIENNMRQEEEATRDYYILSVEIQKFLSLNESNRKIEANQFLDKCYNTYIKLFERSGLLKKTINDSLQPINDTLLIKNSPSNSSNSTNSSVSEAEMV